MLREQSSQLIEPSIQSCQDRGDYNFSFEKQRRRTIKSSSFLLTFYKKWFIVYSMKRYQSKSNSNLFFWVECVTDPQEIFMVVSAVKGHNPTEAHDDWFFNKQDAEEIAQQLANEA